FFNTTGPCNSIDHYMLPATARLDVLDIARLLRQKAYFVLHAPRQTGKTTAMLELARELIASGEYISVLVSMEVGAGFPNDVGAAEDAILDNWRQSIRVQVPKELHPSLWKTGASAGQRIADFLTEWSLEAERPLLIFIDEIDALQDDVLISVLRQLRSGFNMRPTAFPSSVALIGLRDVRDYKVKSGASPHLNTPSPFNIAVRSFTLRNFTGEEIRALLGQHTIETGQLFTEVAQQRMIELTLGQPWLVNALAKVCVEELVQDVTKPIEVHHVNEAKERLILRRQTHLDQLTDKLREERVRHVIEPILAGQVLDAIPLDDRDYVTDLGLVRRLQGGSLAIANPIYGEVILRVLAGSAQDSMPVISPTWLNPDGTLNAENLLAAFLAFWRQHGQPLLRSAPYHEIAPHLVMMAFLHRVVNGNGRIEREYAIGSRRLDMCLFYGETRVAMELKVWRDGEKDPLARGLEQLERYLDGLGLETGWLVIFDQRSGLPDISDRTTTAAAVTPSGKQVVVIRG
ncbi:MAG: ATP-binding protein, partial [Caldilineaceae bacterium]|nr:ATP-binding protein [Caldilineaceae bacterium]